MCRLKYKKAAAFSEKSDQQTADNQDQDGLEWKKSVGKSEKKITLYKIASMLIILNFPLAYFRKFN